MCERKWKGERLEQKKFDEACQSSEVKKASSGNGENSLKNKVETDCFPPAPLTSNQPFWHQRDKMLEQKVAQLLQKWSKTCQKLIFDVNFGLQ